MSVKPNPSDYDGKVTQEQIDELEKLRVAFVKAQEAGSSDLDATREAYQNFAAKILIDLSGKLEPGPDQEPVPPTKPTEGTIKAGGWGGNQDPNTWKAVPMVKAKGRFKIVDDVGKNIATDFTTILTAKEYIAYYLANPSGPVVTPPPQPPGPDGEPPGPGTTDKDQFGIIKIKPDQPGGRLETNFELEGKMRNYKSGKPSEWSSEYTNDSKTPIENVEVTIYEKINGFKTHETDTISDKVGGPPHHDGACCWLIPDFMTDGSAKKTMETEFPHPYNHPVNPAPLSKIGGSLVGQWFGHKVISQQTKTGTRHVESWIHFPVTNIETVKDEQDKWRPYISVDIPDKRFFKASGSLTTSRLDGVKKESLPDFRYASVREIVPA